MKKLLLSFTLLTTISLTSIGQCTITSPATIDITAGNFLYGQSFTAICNGFLNYVQFTANSTGTVSAGTLTIYSGNALATSIYTQSFSAITIANVGDPIRINLSSALAITNGNQYTFEFTVDNVNVLAGSNTYAGGNSFQDGSALSSLDIDFEVDITTSVGIKKLNTTKISIYPNPTTSQLTLNTTEKIERISILDITGKTVKTIILTNNTIEVSDLTKGIYFLHVQTENGMAVSKFIKE